MKISIKKMLAGVIGAAILLSGSVFLAACDNRQTVPDVTVQLTAQTEAPVVTPGPRASAATGTMTFQGETISATEFDFYYYTMMQQYEQYVSYGLIPATESGEMDLTAPVSETDTQTWGDFLRTTALTQLQDMHILESLAKAEGMTITAENLTAIDSFFANMTTNATMSGMELDPYFMTVYGTTATKANLEPVINRYFLASQYMEKVKEAITYTDAELQAFYTENADSYTDTTLPVVRHILYKAFKGVEGSEDATQEELDAAKAAADATLAKVTSYDLMVSVGDAAMADGSAAESAEYTVQTGQMVEEFDSWCFDPARVAGDTAIVQTMYGYHVMYYVGAEKDWYADAVDKVKNDKYIAFILEKEALPEFALTVA